MGGCDMLALALGTKETDPLEATILDYISFRKQSHLKHLTSRRNCGLFPLSLAFATPPYDRLNKHLRVEPSSTFQNAPSPMGSTFATVCDDSDTRWRLITLRLTATLIFTQSTGYEKSWRYL